MKTIKSLILLAVLGGTSLLHAQDTTITWQMGWDATNMPTSLDLTTVDQMLDYGYTSNTTLSSAELTFDVDFGGGAIANFTLTQSWDASNIRQLGASIEGAGSPTSGRDGEVTMTLNSLTGITALTLDGVELGSVTGGDPVVVAPDATFATTGFNTFGSAWTVGQSMLVTHTAQNTGAWYNADNTSTDAFNLEAIQLTATVPEPSTFAALAGSLVLLFAATRRRR